MLNLKSKPNKKNTSNAGFTLLEVMAALAIIAIVLVAVYRMQSQTIGMTIAEKFYTRAPFLAQSKIARIMANNPESNQDDSGDFGTDFPGYSWVSTIEETASEELETESENLKKIDVTVLFNAGEFKYELRSYYYMRDDG